VGAIQPSVINARDEPLADYRKYVGCIFDWRLQHESFANALKIGTTVCILTLLEENLLPKQIACEMPFWLRERYPDVRMEIG